jgi:hypothetical protein
VSQTRKGVAKNINAEKNENPHKKQRIVTPATKDGIETNWSNKQEQSKNLRISSGN